MEGCGAVTVAAFGWPAARLSAEVAARLLRDGYGCAVRIREASPERAAAAIAAGAGEPLIAPGLSARRAPRGMGRAPLFAEDGAGFFVAEWFAASNPSLRTIQDVARRPEIFAAGGGVRPALLLCPAAWACHASGRAVVDALELATGFEIVTPPSGDALTEAIIAADAARRPWLASYWTPSALAAERPMTRLGLGRLEVCDDAGCRPAFTGEAPITDFSPRLAVRAPRVTAFLTRFTLPGAAVREAMTWRSAANASLEDAADRLLSQRPSLLSDWLDAPARAAFLSAELARRDGAP